MIIQTTRISRSGGVGHLARHLLDKTRENDAIEILAGDRSALFDAHTLASFKGCKYSVRHIAVSPEREMTPPQLSEFMRSINSEFCVGAERPRLIVRHLKKGRSHFHIAVGEVDPKTLRVLDCRNDYARLEDIARRYEEKHGETIQPTRADRHQRKNEGFSDIARKRAERVTPAFDRTKLKHGRFSRFVVAENGGPRGSRVRSNTSMMIMRPPQQRHGGRKLVGSSDMMGSVGSAAVSGSGSGATLRSLRARVRLALRAPPATSP